MTWGPLTPLATHLAREDHEADGDKDRKQSDTALAKLLGGEELAGAIQAASLEQLDLALVHDALAVERKPLCNLTLLSAKASKLEAWVARKGAPQDDKAAQRAASARLATQLSHFLSQVPISVAVKELKKVSQLTAQYVALVVELRQAIKAVYPLKAFLRRFHVHGHTVVTALHANFFYLCLQAKTYSAASDILDQQLFEVHSQSNVVSPVDFLGYAYYGGVLHLGQKKYQEAIDFFLSAVTAPAVVLSAFVVEAYKKLVLASLILHGESPPLPKYTPFVVTRHLEIHCGPYNELVRAFAVDKDLQKVANVAQNHAASFAKDGNFGLVKQVVTALKQRKLLQLPRTYVTIALSEMTKAAAMEESGDSEAEKLLLQLIAHGDMAAVIDKQKQMVTFVLDDGDEASEAEQARVMETLQTEMEKLLFVAAQLRAMDTDVVTSAKFQHRAQKEKERRQRGAQGGDDRGALLGPMGWAGQPAYDPNE